MERRRRKKKAIGDEFYDVIIPLGGCAFVIFLAAFVCLHTSLSTGGPLKRTRTTTTLRSAEDAQYKLNMRQIYKQSKDENSNEGSADDKESLSNSDYRDPGFMDKALTRLEKSRVEKLRLPRTIETVNGDLPYDIHRCPSVIPKNYPYAWSILDVLKHWNPDDTRIPDTIHQGLCAIDWRDPLQRKVAVHYRKNEVPFIIKHNPVIGRVVDRWSNYDYLHGILGDKTYLNEHSKNNHMMFWRSMGEDKDPFGWKPPTEKTQLSYPDWYQKAMSLEDDPDSSTTAEHFYFRLIGKKGSNEWLFDEIPFFKRIQHDVFMADPDEEPGLFCRFGSRGTIAELHHDMSRNNIFILQGQKRYVLGHPDQCINMELYQDDHPSARHSRINWSDPESWLHGGKNFRNGMVNEVVMDAGDGLYLPTYWLHFIVSLSFNYQCNARSGFSNDYEEHIKDCGF